MRSSHSKKVSLDQDSVLANPASTCQPNPDHSIDIGEEIQGETHAMKSARVSITPSLSKEMVVQSQQTLINELNFATTKRLESKQILPKVEEMTDEAFLLP